MFPKLCAVEDSQACRGFFKILHIYTSFQPELNKCCREVTVGNIGDRVTLPEKVVNSKKRPSPFSLSHVMQLAISINRFMLLLCSDICLAFLLCQQTKNVRTGGIERFSIPSFIVKCNATPL